MIKEVSGDLLLTKAQAIARELQFVHQVLTT